MTIYRCGAVPDRFDTMVRDGRGRHHIVDIHAHMGVPAAAALAQPHFDPSRDPNARYTSPASQAVNRRMAETIRPALTTVEAKLADMDRMGIDMQVLSPAPPQYYYWADPELGLATSRLINEAIADAVARHPDRFAGFATLPIQAPELAVREMRRAVDELGLKGVEISTNVDGRELSDPAFAPVFAAAEDMGLVVFLHPLGFSHGERLATHYLNNIVGNPLESTVAVSHLIFGGVLDRHPGLKICVAHGGGYLPAYSGRMDHAFHARDDCRGCHHPPSHYLRRLYFDTVLFDRTQLRHLVEVYGADHLLMGTDHPFDMGESDPVGFVRGTPGLSERDVDAILGGNATDLLCLDRTLR
ncbi:amidohydrolase family protein [Acuticoccus mangrovi]|uniref:Amidohydrolase n=1 Tax=Acuticoccus mangrovi TaxID=2796142 RepID=A0A934MEQ0_9HYPH|nr:amidohydrolase family protein [Acuticoccus mangrovi]MBJ3774613.1 amidohydrolase [Acuticoccus mangrovi]